jgi:Chaperone of endosialidase
MKSSSALTRRYRTTHTALVATTSVAAVLGVSLAAHASFNDPLCTTGNCLVEQNQTQNGASVGITGTSDCTDGTAGAAGVAGFSRANATGGTAWGVDGESWSSYGVHGINVAGNSAGVYGTSGPGGIGVKGEVLDSHTSTIGVFGNSQNIGIKGTGFYGNGVYGSSNNTHGVSGTSNGSWPAAGVYGTATGSANLGVYGHVIGSGGYGVWGDSITGTGVEALALGSGGFGLQAVANGSSGHAIDAICNSSCTNSGYAGYFHGNVWTTGTYGGSDIRLKKDIVDSKYGLEQVMKMRPVTFKWKEGDEQTQVGLIAQDISKLVPELVRAGDQGMLGINYNGVGPVLIKAIQEQQKMIEGQQAQIARLERGRAPLVSYVVPGSLAGLALGLVPLGFVVTRRRRDDERADEIGG